MALNVGTHSGTFHADDVLAFALIRSFVDAEATVLRTRDKSALVDCDIVIDVGGIYDPEALRFDHHQSAYQGPRSSAGMILDWLEESGRVSPSLATHLRDRLVDYIDAVDTGREAPRLDVPCFARIVEAIGQQCDDPSCQDDAFRQASDIGVTLVSGLVAQHDRIAAAHQAVLTAMSEAEAEGRSVMFLDQYYPWKPIYFAHGGEDHPTDFVAFPSDDDTWKVIAIPPRLGCFDQKRSLPASWAGLMGDELTEATGVEGSVFCHKNRFIAVFQTFDGAMEALKRFGLYEARPASAPSSEPAVAAHG